MKPSLYTSLAARPWIALGACSPLAAGCGMFADDVGNDQAAISVVQDPGAGASLAPASDAGAGSSGTAPGQTDNLTPGQQRALELAAEEAIAPEDATEPVPLCRAPLVAPWSYPTYGAEAVRLVWEPESRECQFISYDTTPEGWEGILTVRRKDGETHLSTIGLWRYYHGPALDIQRLENEQSVSFYPYLEAWQFQAQLEFDDEKVTLSEFNYISGTAPSHNGRRPDIPDRLHQPIRQDTVPCASLDLHEAEEPAADSTDSAATAAETTGAETTGAETTGAETTGAETTGAETTGAETTAAAEDAQ